MYTFDMKVCGIIAAKLINPKSNKPIKIDQPCGLHYFHNKVSLAVQQFIRKRTYSTGSAEERPRSAYSFS